MKLQRRDALSAIKALRDEPLPLFAAAAEHEAPVIPEQQFPESTKSHEHVYQELEHSAAELEAVDQQYGRGAALNLSHRTVIQSLAVE